MAMVTFDAAKMAELDRMYSSPQVREQRRAMRAALAVRPGERGLDIGCGPGHLACELAADLAPGGRMTGLDSSADALAACRARGENEGVAACLDTREGDAARIPFPERTFDFAVASQVYCHVPAVDAALAEARRVLRGGGRLLVLETDPDMCIYRARDEALARQLYALRAESHHANPRLPRTLPGRLHAAGFRLLRAEALPILETRYDPAGYGVIILPSLRQAGIRAGIAQEKLDAWEADLHSRKGEGEWFFCLNRFLFLAEAP